MTRESVLLTAHRLVHGDRQEQYDHPALIYARVGRIWAAILGVPDIPPATVCLMLAGMKLGREAQKPREDLDNLVDAAGYAECVALCREVDSPAQVPTNQRSDL